MGSSWQALSSTANAFQHARSRAVRGLDFGRRLQRADSAPTSTSGTADGQRVSDAGAAQGVPKAALLFLAPWGVANEALWAAFLEHASLLQLPQLPPPAAAAREIGDVDLQALVGGPLYPELPQVTILPPWQFSSPSMAQLAQRKAAQHAQARAGQHTGGGGGGGGGCALAGELSEKRSDRDQLNQAWARLHCHGAAAADAAAAHAQPGAAGTAAAGKPQQKKGAKGEAEAGAVPGADAARCTHPLAQRSAVWRRYYSLLLYMVPGAGRVADRSLFCGSQLEPEVDTMGGFAQHVLMEAVLSLLAAALRDPLNARFCILSESSVPLRPPALVWAQLVAEERSRLETGCSRDVPWVLQRDEMWHPMMETSRLQCRHWRKSSQWAVLTRPHAALAVADRHVSEAFRRYCYTSTWRLPGDRVSRETRAAASHAERVAQLALLDTYWETVKGCGAAVAARAALAEGAAFDTEFDTEFDPKALLHELTGLESAATGAVRGGANATATAGDGMDRCAAAGSTALGGGARALVGGELQAWLAGEHGREVGAACAAFLRLLAVMPGKSRECISDENYLPTLLAAYGLEAQGTCYHFNQSGSHHTEYLPWHAKAFGRVDVANFAAARAQFLRVSLSAECDADATGRSAAVGRLLAAAPASSSASAAGGGGGGGAPPVTLREWLKRKAGFEPMPANCPLFARKFHDEQAAFAFALSCDGLRVGSWCGGGA